LAEAPGGWDASREAVATALKKAAVELNFPASDFATHSLRIGGATALFGAGVSFEEVRRFGRWASDCWRRYVYESRESTRDFACKIGEVAIYNANVSGRLPGGYDLAVRPTERPGAG